MLKSNLWIGVPLRFDAAFCVPLPLKAALSFRFEIFSLSRVFPTCEGGKPGLTIRPDNAQRAQENAQQPQEVVLKRATDSCA